MRNARLWCLVLTVVLAAPAAANHPVFVEGNNAGDAGPGATSVTPGTAGDWDGDGRVGTAEDTDNGTDRVFGTLSAALLATNGGANANGHVMIVTSGRFAEIVRLPNAGAGQGTLNGVTVIEAAPGVEAVIDAVLGGDAAGSTNRQATTGIAVNTPETDRVVVLRNLVIRNFTVGLEVQGNARVLVENCRFDSNLAANVRVSGNGRLTMTGSTVAAGGMRFNPTKGTPNPGDGVAFEGAGGGSIAQTTIAGNTAAGIRNAGTGVVRALFTTLADNGADVDGAVEIQPPPACPPPVVNATVGPCARCNTKKGVTKCRKCGVSVQ